MSNAVITSTNNLRGKELSALLPINPFRSLLVHFGMLLGVDDFETLDAYHRGKMWMHTAWLHREGAVWGLKVSLENNEIRVSRGLAVDALGRELYLEADACLNVGQWYEEHKDDDDLKDIVSIDPESGKVSFDAHVVIQFKSCMARQVPALSEPCDDAGTTTAYSRVVETVELLLKPGKAPEWRDPGSLPYHRLRLLFALESPIEKEGVVISSDKEVLDARAGILDLPREQQPAAYLAAFRRFGAMDEMDMVPAAGEGGEVLSLFPARDPAPIPLADVEISLQPVQNGWNLTGSNVDNVDNTVRPVHVATSTIQELLCGPQAPPCEGIVGPPAPDAGGPRVIPETVRISGKEITFEVNRELLEASVDKRGISVRCFDESTGWRDQEEEIEEVGYVYIGEDAVAAEVNVTLEADPTGNRVRLIVKGTGEFPLLGVNGRPLAGAVGGPPGSEFNGNDFVYMFEI